MGNELMREGINELMREGINEIRVWKTEEVTWKSPHN